MKNSLASICSSRAFSLSLQGIVTFSRSKQDVLTAVYEIIKPRGDVFSYKIYLPFSLRDDTLTHSSLWRRRCSRRGRKQTPAALLQLFCWWKRLGFPSCCSHNDHTQTPRQPQAALDPRVSGKQVCYGSSWYADGLWRAKGQAPHTGVLSQVSNDIQG